MLMITIVLLLTIFIVMAKQHSMKTSVAASKHSANANLIKWTSPSYKASSKLMLT